MSNQITFINDICGSGKTSVIIKEINKSTEDVKFVYATPFLTEAARIVDACPTKDFQEPSSSDTADGGCLPKIVDFENKLNQGHNIACSHELLRGLLLADIDYSNHVLVLDEVLELASTYKKLSFKDVTKLLEYEQVVIDPETKQIKTTPSFMPIPDLMREQIKFIDNGCLYLSDRNVVILQLPMDILFRFKEVIVMSYLVEGSWLYQMLSKTNANVSVKMVDDSVSSFIPYDSAIATQRAKKAYDLISVYKPQPGANNEYDKILNICTLSFSATTKKMSDLGSRKIGKLIKNFLMNHLNARQGTTIISCFDKKIIVPSFQRSYLAFNSRATNEYGDTNVLVYLIDKNQNQILQAWFNQTSKITVNANMADLDAMIQWIFRSAIRNGKPVTLFLPSPKMRKLLEQWGSGSLF